MKLLELAERIGARLLGDGEVEVSRVRHVEEAQAGDVAFAASARERRAAYGTKAGALLVDESFAADHAHELPCAVLASDQPGRALVRAVEALHAPAPMRTGVDARAVVDALASVAAGAYVGPLAVVGRARIASGARVMPLAYVGDDVDVGEGAVIGVGAVVLDGTTVGARSVVGPGSVLGDEGFVFAPRGDANERLRHTARVVLGEDVDVGANACIDRGALRDTRVGSGARVDNLVQVGHDVQLGENSVLVAQVGVAGDAVVGESAILTGQVGVQEHTRIGARARIGGRAAVTRDVGDGEAVSGLPLMPHGDWLRAMAVLKRLPEMERRLRRLENDDE